MLVELNAASKKSKRPREPKRRNTDIFALPPAEVIDEASLEELDDETLLER